MFLMSFFSLAPPVTVTRRKRAGVGAYCSVSQRTCYMKMTGSVRFRQLRAGAGLFIGDLVTSVSLSWKFATKSNVKEPKNCHSRFNI